MSEHEHPHPRCPHGYKAVIQVDAEGWNHPIGSPESRCGCAGKPVGIPYKLGGEAPPPQPEPEQRYRRCTKTPGCIIVMGYDDPDHTAPCLVDEPKPAPAQVVDTSRCVVCGDAFTPNAVRVPAPGGLRHAEGSPACRRPVVPRT